MMDFPVLSEFFTFLPAFLGVKHYVISNNPLGDIENFSHGFSVLPLPYVHNKLFYMGNCILQSKNVQEQF